LIKIISYSITVHRYKKKGADMTTSDSKNKSLLDSVIEKNKLEHVLEEFELNDFFLTPAYRRLLFSIVTTYNKPGVHVYQVLSIAGLGKSTFARILGSSLFKNSLIINSNSDATPADIRGLYRYTASNGCSELTFDLSSMLAFLTNDIDDVPGLLVIDESSLLSPGCYELFRSVITEKVLSIPEEGFLNRKIINKITIMFLLNNEVQLKSLYSEAMVNRFKTLFEIPFDAGSVAAILKTKLKDRRYHVLPQEVKKNSFIDEMTAKLSGSDAAFGYRFNLRDYLYLFDEMAEIFSVACYAKSEVADIFYATLEFIASGKAKLYYNKQINIDSVRTALNLFSEEDQNE